MAQLGMVGQAPTKQTTILDRLIEIRGKLRNAHSRLTSANSRAGLLPPVPTEGSKAGDDCADLSGVVTDIEALSEHLTQNCCDIERIV